MKVDVLSESSEQYKTRSTTKSFETPFPGFRIVTYDFEYVSVEGERPNPVCLVCMIGNQGGLVISGGMSC